MFQFIFNLQWQEKCWWQKDQNIRYVTSLGTVLHSVENCRNLLSQLFGKEFVKSTYHYITKELFDEITFQVRANIFFKVEFS